ncbi:hypothetical protein EMIHUDRAFT_209854 [Emiliania huxleyi CCMP1516]|uniref:Uncharacterized protein n=2 Tax=Emiliania huxleyi TaxID=2903 RepID=A0A0D3J2W2_EMIH1|nr:hypothetical protein EMIHUDRAFT_209854 [Emiliania huxleyi CCMP1516]EOD17847.1 hypothetical protein EMIHUDRAFT_209854 [Emiliania huxleyi CCMP1516]|eukprot:XP_005770276.1 hypothetical protein EMIHUDRAFT_209854 [Emiliania huxleyi CCMP1516]
MSAAPAGGEWWRQQHGGRQAVASLPALSGWLVGWNAGGNAESSALARDWRPKVALSGKALSHDPCALGSK